MARIRPLTGQVAVVTGAGSGIGRSLARLLDRKGCPLALCDVDAQGLKDTAAELSHEPFTKVVDVADREAMTAFAVDVQDAHGRADLVVNNAGVDLSQTVDGMTYDDFEWLMGINFWGVVHGTKEFLPGMLERRHGTIVNISSIFGIFAFPTHSAYCASKFAVRGFTESLRSELHDTGVSAVLVHPGGIDTNIVRNSRFYVDDLGDGDKEQMAEQFAKIARTSPDQAAATIVDGVEKGKKKILVGGDAKAADTLARLSPVRYYEVIRRGRRFAQ